MKNLFSIALILFTFIAFGQQESEIEISEQIDGTLLMPENGSKTLAIIIAGSGPTDRNGNQNFLKSNNLKKLANGLSKNNIATFRYDKRVVKQIRKDKVDPNIMFDDFVSDARDVINYFKDKKSFDKIYVIGHSQGSLVGMLASKDLADGYVSIAGAGQTIDKVIIDQVAKTAPMFTEDTERVFKVIAEGKATDDYPPALASIFNKDIQKFLGNWMQYQPTEEIKKLDIPILIINGTKDLQVSVEEANLLSEASEKAELKIIEKMNHVLFIIEGDDQENAKSYNDQSLKVSEELIQAISDFIKQ